MYSYDPTGCIERLQYSASGAGEPILQPFLDNQVAQETMADEIKKIPLTIERAISLLRDAFRFASERETSTGDQIYIAVAQAGKPIQTSYVPLRED